MIRKLFSLTLHRAMPPRTDQTMQEIDTAQTLTAIREKVRRKTRASSKPRWWFGALLMLVQPAISAADTTSTRLYYEILDGDKLIGHIDISLESSAQGLVARQRGELSLKRMMLTANVKQTVEEHWQGRSLLALTAETSAEVAVGDSKKSLSVVRDASGILRATIDKKTRELPSNALPMSIWSGRALVEGPHFDITTGDTVEFKASSQPNAEPETVVRYQDKPCQPSRFEAINGKKRSLVAAWLGGDDIVCQLRISAGGDVITYVRRPAP